ncbi:MAG: glycosyltransferase [Candidatus Binatia bacterium]|nr:glycosyltransferase [Candidatus Binatia bacterium]
MSQSGSCRATKPNLCFYGTYPSSYTVSRILEKAAVDAGFRIVRCHQPFLESPLTSPAFTRPRHLLWFAARYVASAARLWGQLARCPAEILVAGFRGQLDVLLASLLRQTRQRKLVFAPLVTVSETVLDRGLSASSPSAVRLAGWLDRRSLNLADRVIIDTHTHSDYLRRTFGVSDQKVRVFHLGYDTETFRPSPPRKSDATLRVLFYGSLLPLHGVGVMISAARLLARETGIRFTFCGRGWLDAEVARQLAELPSGNVTRRGWIDYAQIPKLIADHDVCLGIFAANEKAAMVIPNKVYQCSAVGRTVVTADTPAVREVFEHNETIILVPPDNPEALANALLDLRRDREKLTGIATNAARWMQEQFAAPKQAERFASTFVASLE